MKTRTSKQKVNMKRFEYNRPLVAVSAAHRYSGTFGQSATLYEYSGEDDTLHDVNREDVAYIVAYLLLLPKTFYLDW